MDFEISHRASRRQGWCPRGAPPPPFATGSTPPAAATDAPLGRSRLSGPRASAAAVHRMPARHDARLAAVARSLLILATDTASQGGHKMFAKCRPACHQHGYSALQGKHDLAGIAYKASTPKLNPVRFRNAPRRCQWRVDGWCRRRCALC